MIYSRRSARTRLSAVAVTATAALTLAACGGSTTDGTQDTEGSPSTVTSTLTATANSEKTSGSIAKEKTSDSKAGVAPLGDANTAMKTLRPEAPAELMVTGMRVGQHDNFERVVFDLEGTGSPGWFIDYTSKPAQQGSGNPVQVEGSTALNVNIDGTVMPFELGKEDPNLGTLPGSGGLVTEIISLGTFEGRSQFIIGLNGNHPYSVQVLEEPTRLVIDILHSS